MFLHQIDLTTALRPSLLPDETLLFVQDAVGLYDGKYKIPAYQHGHAYLTSHRVCYVDNANPRSLCVGVDLKDVDHLEFYAGFLKSSAKISLFPKTSKRLSSYGRVSGSNGVRTLSASPSSHGSPLRAGTPSAPVNPFTNATWICKICSFSNPIPSNFDPATANAHTPLPPCLACGIKPQLIEVSKAALAALRGHSASTSSTTQPSKVAPEALTSSNASAADHTGSINGLKSIQCPRCTFENHPSMNTCEMCQATLISRPDPRFTIDQPDLERADSPGPSLPNGPVNDDSLECIKLSFRAGGEKIFHQRLKEAMTQSRWKIQGAPAVQTLSQAAGPDKSSVDIAPGGAVQNLRPQGVGIAGLERRGDDLRKNNEAMIGSAFEDLKALMDSAKEIITLAESFSQQAKSDPNSNSESDQLLSQSMSALGLTMTKDMLGAKSESIYVSELSRNVAEFLTDDRTGVLRKEGGIMTLVDLWAVFNRARNGIELVSPADFEKAAQMWDTLKLPVRLRQFKSGLLVVQGRDRTDEKTIASILEWLRSMHRMPTDIEVPWNCEVYGRGVSPQETAEQFGWSVGVATEELEMAEEKGALCREQSMGGIRFWENWLAWDPA